VLRKWQGRFRRRRAARAFEHGWQSQIKAEDREYAAKIAEKASPRGRCDAGRDAAKARSGGNGDKTA